VKLGRLVFEAYSSLPPRTVSEICGVLDIRISLLSYIHTDRGRWYSREGRGIFCNVGVTASRTVLIAGHVRMKQQYVLNADT
jgi:hypothetical protein